jgi:hypothetical protein
MTTKKFVLFISFSLYVAGTGLAQIELPEGTTKGLEKYNKEQKAKETPNAAEDDKQSEKEKAWEKMWEDNKKDFSEAASYFDTKALNCLFLSILYIDGYLQLKNLADNEQEGQLKCDLLGTQVSAIGMSTMILYCPEYLVGLSDSEFKELVFDPIQAMEKDKNKPQSVELWHGKFAKIMMWFRKRSGILDGDGHYIDIQDLLNNFFSPESIVVRSLQIGRQMEELGCDDY